MSSTLESLSSLVNVLNPQEVELAERMLASRKSYFVTLRILAIPYSAPMVVMRPSTGKATHGNLLHHFRRSVLVRFEDGQSETIQLEKIVSVN
jgi:hypothetical protein